MIYDALIAPFTEFEFMRRALAAVIALSLGGAPIGVFLMLRRMSLVGDAMAHAILPGAVDTPMLWNNPNIKSGAEQVDPSFVGKPEDVAAAIAFLASDDAAFVDGTTLVVDGGRLARL